MKKELTFLVLLIVVFSIASCSGTNTTAAKKLTGYKVTATIAGVDYNFVVKKIDGAWVSPAYIESNNGTAVTFSNAVEVYSGGKEKPVTATVSITIGTAVYQLGEAIVLQVGNKVVIAIGDKEFTVEVRQNSRNYGELAGLGTKYGDDYENSDYRTIEPGAEFTVVKWGPFGWEQTSAIVTSNGGITCYTASGKKIADNSGVPAAKFKLNTGFGAGEVFLGNISFKLEVYDDFPTQSSTPGEIRGKIVQNKVYFTFPPEFGPNKPKHGYRVKITQPGGHVYETWIPVLGDGHWTEQITYHQGSWKFTPTDPTNHGITNTITEVVP